MNAMNRVVSDVRRSELRAIARRSREAILLAATAGAATGVGVAFLEWITIDRAFERVLGLPAAWRPWMPLIGLVAASVIVRRLGDRSVRTADEYIVSFHSHDDMDLRPLPARLLAGVASVGSGVPCGLEGASLYLGAGVGTALQRRFRAALGTMGAHSLMVAGAAAGVAAIFKAPATGAVFAMEVPYRDDLGRRLLLPALVGAATGYLAFVALQDPEPLLVVRGHAPFDLRDLLGAAALGIGVGVVVRAYARLIRWAKSFQLRTSPWIAVPAGGTAIAVTALVSHDRLGGDLALGPGYAAIEWATDPRHAWWAVALLVAARMVGTIGTLAGGGVIGLFLPLVVVGGLLGRLVGGLVDAPNLTMFIVVGVAAGLGAGYRVPLAAVMFIAETSGRPGFIVPGLLAAVGADLVMGDSSVTPYQQSSSAVNEYH